MKGSAVIGWTGNRKPAARRPELQTVKLSVRYARYVLTSVATVAFGFAVN